MEKSKTPDASKALGLVAVVNDHIKDLKRCVPLMAKLNVPLMAKLNLVNVSKEMQKAADELRVAVAAETSALKKGRKTVHLYVQEGGSSTEIYLHAFNTAKQAAAGRRSCAAASYGTSQVVSAPASLVDHPEFFNVVEALLKGSLDVSYGDAE